NPSDASDDESSGDLKELTNEQALGELEQIAGAIRELYGAIEYKSERFGFDLDRELATARSSIQASKTEGDRIRAIKVLLAALNDGHVRYNLPVKSTTSRSFDLPLELLPFDGVYAIGTTTADLPTGSPVVKGDVLVSIDGRTTQEMERDLASVTPEVTPEQHR